ncbi:hypothetical protein Trydic_g4573 [Trypoxylus dichotomus]
MLKTLEVDNLQPNDRPIFPYNTSDTLKVIGKFVGTFKVGATQTQAEVIVVEGDGEALLSYETKKVEDELNRLGKEGIIEKVTGPTCWISPTVIVPKSQDVTAIRLYVDMRAANKAISRVRNVTPTTDYIITQPNGTKVFSKIDLKEEYHQLTLAEESRHITTFATHIGLFRKSRYSQNNTKQLLRSKIWFPNIDEATEKEVRKCTAYQITDNTKYKDPIQLKEIPRQPFLNIDMDHARPFPNHKYVLLLIDEYSRYPFIEIVDSTKFTDLKPVLQKIFAMVGIPLKITSDNGPPFNGKEFSDFMLSYGIKHCKTTPFWPQANGMVERLVKTVKQSLICANFETNKFDVQLQEFLLNYRSTPHLTTLKSPFELVFNRKMNNFLPAVIPVETTQNRKEEGNTKCSSKTEDQMENKITINVENEDEEITDIEEEAKTPSSENAETFTEENLYGRRWGQIRPPQRFKDYDMDYTSSD